MAQANAEELGQNCRRVRVPLIEVVPEIVSLSTIPHNTMITVVIEASDGSDAL
jgi:hypothetical protein